jgi:hypothetical protein
MYFVLQGTEIIHIFAAAKQKCLNLDKTFNT